MSHPTRFDIRKVVVILAGSRTGSSFLFKALNAHGRFLSPTGEETPFYRSGGLGVFNAVSYSDSLDGSVPDAVLDLVSHALLNDIGQPTARCEDREALAESYLTRLNLQWPDALSSIETEKARVSLLEKFARLPGGYRDWHRLYIDWVDELHRSGVPVNSDLFLSSSEHPEELALVEEPPYVTPMPKQRVTSASAAELPLLLKTSTNVYRIPFLRKLFPRAEFKWIVLLRNPAATISALMDGWLSSAFHSHDVYPHAELKIDGYSDIVPGGGRYWKFDMPPGWTAFTESGLAQVCAHQWYSSYRLIDGFMPSPGESIHQVHYEQLLDRNTCGGLIERLNAFAGASLREEPLSGADEPVLAVRPPQAGKWKKREKEITSALHNYRDGDILSLAKHFDYDPERITLWP